MPTQSTQSAAQSTQTTQTGLAAEPLDSLPGGRIGGGVMGGGAPGRSGARLLARSRRSVVVLDAGDPRNAPAEGVHALLGHDGIAPAEFLRRGRAEVRGYGGLVVQARVVAARPESRDDDPSFSLDLADGRVVTARRILVATGLRDELPEVDGLAAHWGRGVVHCPYCHGWEVRDRAIGVLATGPMSVHQALLFRQLSEDLVYFTGGAELDEESRTRLAARDIRIVEEPVTAVVDGPGGGLGAVQLAGGDVVAREVVAVATRMVARTDGLEGLGLPIEEVQGGMGIRFVAGTAGTTEVPGVWVAGNATDVSAQVGASAAAGALAGAHMNAQLVTAETDAAVAELARRPEGALRTP